MKIDFDSGGAEVIDRIIKAYGFKNKLEFSNYLGTSSANMSTRYKKGFFPSDWVIRCMAETGASLEWLATGEGELSANEVAKKNGLTELSTWTLHNGDLIRYSTAFIDETLFPDHLNQPILVKFDNNYYVADTPMEDVQPGKYLIDLEDRVGIYDLERIPINKVRLSGSDLKSFIECNISDITIISCIVASIIKYRE